MLDERKESGDVRQNEVMQVVEPELGRWLLRAKRWETEQKPKDAVCSLFHPLPPISCFLYRRNRRCRMLDQPSDHSTLNLMEARSENGNPAD